jgi:hypothetical protein
MKKKLLIFVSSLFIAISSFSQNNPDSIINHLNGEWILQSYSGGFCGCTIPADTVDPINLILEKNPNSINQITYKYYIEDSILINGTAKVDYTSFTNSQNIYGWYIEDLNGKQNPFRGKMYFSVTDSSIALIPDPMQISDGQNQHYKRKVDKGNKFVLQGQVNSSDSVWNYGIVFLYDALTKTLIDSVQIQNGSYLFNEVSSGKYTLYIVPYADSSLNKFANGCIPTFYVNKATLEEANTFEVNADTYGVDFKLRDEIVLSNNELNQINCKIYPNPFVSNITIDAGQSNFEIRVINIEGVVIHNSIGNQIINLNTESWKKGVYIIEIRSNSSVTFSKIIKN